MDYESFNDDYFDSLSDLEFSAFENYRQFLEELEDVLLKATMIQIPELVVAHLCCYLGSVIAVYKGDKAKQLEPDIINLLKRHADLAFAKFDQYPISSSVASQTQKEANLNKLRENSPGSIVHQTLRLGRFIMDMMRRLGNNRDDKLGFSQQKQEELFCPQTELLEFLIPLLNKHHHEWHEKLESKSINHAINQLTIQIGWLIGYFAHLDKQSPDKGQYLEYALSCITLYREYTHELLQDMPDKDQVLTSMEDVDDEKEPATDPKLNPLLHEIRNLSSKTHAAIPPAVTDFQKETAIVQSKIEKLLIELLMDNMEVKLVLMSVFHFWFMLDAALRVDDPSIIDEHAPFEEMGNIIKLVKTTTQSLPDPNLSSDLKQLNAKMQLLKSQHLPDPRSLDQVSTEQAHEHTPKVTTAIHTLTSDFLKQGFHPEVIANVLFSQWLRLSAFYGISESEYQKMDHYFPEIITAVRDYLPTAIRKRSKNKA